MGSSKRWAAQARWAKAIFGHGDRVYVDDTSGLSPAAPAMEGFARSLFELMDLSLPVLDYSTVCKRAKHLTVNLPKTASDGPIHVVVDSTGLKVFGEGEWKVRKHGYLKRRTWRKLHLGVNSATHGIQAVVLTEASVDDAEVVEAAIKCAALNRMTHLGMPDSYRV